MSFTYKGTTSDSMGFNVTERMVYTAPAYDINAVEVPGRSGDILNPQNRFKNKKITYKGFVRAAGFVGATQRAKLSNGLIALKGWLCSDAGQYNTLTDDYDPGFTRRAYIDGETAFTEVHDSANGVTLTVTFNAEPYMLAADATQTITSSGTVITNPYSFNSLPKIVLTMSGTGELVITNSEGTTSWTIGSYTGTLTVDSETMDWYDSSDLQNDLVTGDGFPTLAPGSNTISWTGSISQAVVTPRWRTL